jgi:hypothetical protein
MRETPKSLKSLTILVTFLLVMGGSIVFAQNTPGKAASKKQKPAAPAPRYSGSSKSDSNYGSGHTRRKQKMRKRTRYQSE